MEKIKSIVEEKAGFSKKTIEQQVNSWSIGNFFLDKAGNLYDDNIVIELFANSLAYFWKLKLEKIFPNKNIIVDIKENYMGEYGTTITVYEDDE